MPLYTEENLDKLPKKDLIAIILIVQSQISATDDEDMEEIGRLNSKGRRQNVSGQLSGLWSLRGESTKKSVKFCK